MARDERRPCAFVVIRRLPERRKELERNASGTASAGLGLTFSQPRMARFRIADAISVSVSGGLRRPFHSCTAGKTSSSETGPIRAAQSSFVAKWTVAATSA
jgi:hypothetical protein